MVRFSMNARVLAQLALVHVGVSITVVPVTGTLNRVMIADMQMPVTLVGILVALPYLLSPLQIFLGNWSIAILPPITTARPGFSSAGFLRPPAVISQFT